MTALSAILLTVLITSMPMKAIQVQKTGGPEALTLVDLPVPQPKANEAVVKISAAGVNFIDVYFREGRYPAPVPFVAGQEAAGTVTEIGSDVKSLKPGDRVAYTGVMGSYAAYAAVPADRLVRVPNGITDQQAAAACWSLIPEGTLTRRSAGTAEYSA